MYRLQVRRVVMALASVCLIAAGCTECRQDLSGPVDSTDGVVSCARVIRDARQAVTSAVAPDTATQPPDEDGRPQDRVGVYEHQVAKEHQSAVAALYRSLTALAGTATKDDPKALNRAVTAAAERISRLEARCQGKVSDEHRLPPGAHKIKHVVIVMQENRSFDHYFGTFPGADGIPTRNGVPTVCIPNPATGGCTRPWHSSDDADKGGPHTYEDSIASINDGRMDGFIRQWHRTRKFCLDPAHARGKTCIAESFRPDVMSYHDRREIPNYWTYAEQFVLQDHMFEPNMGWSQPAHLALVSGWSAVCKNPFLAVTCRTSVTFNDVDASWPDAPSYGWTDLTYLLHKHGVRWRYYVAPGSTDDCEGTTDEQIHCTPGVEGFEPIGTPEPWNPLPDFTTVVRNQQVRNVQKHPKFFAAARRGKLPAVSWVVPGWYDSEHPPELVSRGQAWVTRVVNAVMRSPNWKHSAIFVTWDDWGGYYDHVEPPRVDDYSYGLRVPAFMVSPYAKRGYIDHQVLAFDAYLKFIEDLFLEGSRLDPFTTGRWDPRPRVAETEPILGDLMKEFDFSQPPRPPLILDPYPS